MRIVLIGILFLLSISCKRESITYSYNGITIERVDSDGKSSFYYVKAGIKSGEIWAEYSGINDGFSGYLIFEPDGKVILAIGDGYFQRESDSWFRYQHILRAERPSDLQNVCRIMYPVEAEKERNINSLSKVQIVYK